MAKCSFCAETIPARCEVCPHCDADLLNDRVPTSSKSSGSKSAVVTIVVVICGGFFVLIAILIALLLPAVQQAREAARRSQCKNNLKQIAIALHTYHEIYNCFPPAYTVDANGKPLHSWRVLILPYLDEMPLYSLINQNEPWDSPANSAYRDQMPAMFRCPSHSPDGPGLTHYLAIVGDECVLRPANGRPIREIFDGASNTLLVSESNLSVNWMEPRDIPFESLTQVGDLNGVSGSHAPANSAQVVLGDGSVRFLSSQSKIDLKALSTVAGNEAIEIDAF